MKKILITTLFLVGILFIQIPAVSAWNWNTHEEIVESNYNSLPLTIKENLDLNAMKQGAVDPDFKFLDFKYHGYPNSYQKAEEWLNRGQKSYEKSDYYYASYCYGVASHYITDSFSAPHSAGISGPNHTLYEAKASFLEPEVIQSNDDLNSALIDGQPKCKADWNNWLKSKDDSYIQNDMNMATSASYNAIEESISTSNPIREENLEKRDSGIMNNILIPLMNLI